MGHSPVGHHPVSGEGLDVWVLAGGGDDSTGDSGEKHQQLRRQGAPWRRKGGGQLPLSPPLLTGWLSGPRLPQEEA